MASASTPTRAPAVLAPDRLSEVIAITAVALMDAMEIGDRRAAGERLANRLHGFGLTPGGSDAARMLSAIGVCLMRLEQ